MTSTSDKSKKGLSNTELFAILSDSTRRQILLELALCSQRRNAEVDLKNIIANDEELGRLRIELDHNHLPRLEDAELINWNHETDIITKGKQFKEIQPFIELLHEHQEKLPDDWP